MSDLITMETIKLEGMQLRLCYRLVLAGLLHESAVSSAQTDVNPVAGLRMAVFEHLARLPYVNASISGVLR